MNKQNRVKVILIVAGFLVLVAISVILYKMVFSNIFNNQDPYDSDFSSSHLSQTVSHKPNALTPTEIPENVTVTTGIFQNLEWGDYLYLYMTDDDEVEYSFFVLHETSLDPESLTEGQKIKVLWQNADAYMDPPGEEINFDYVVDIILIN